MIFWGRTWVAVLGFSAAAVICVGAAELTFPDLDGRLHVPLRNTSQPATVLLFVMHDCPAANGYWPEFNRIAARFTNAAFFVVHADPDLTPAGALAHAKDYSITVPVLLDPKQKLAKAVGATVSPEAVVVSPKGRRLYRGRIDDRIAALGKKRPQPTTRDLRDALEAIESAKPIRVKETKAIGCYLPELK